MYVVWRSGESESQACVICIYVECDFKWCWWYWNEMMLMLMLMMILRWNDVGVDDDIEMRWCWCWWCHWDKKLLMLMMSLWWMYVVYVHGGYSDHVRYPWRGKRIGLRILSILGEGRGLLRIFNHPRSMHWWCPCFILHNCIEIVQTLSVSTCGFSWEKMLVLKGISLGLELPWDSCWST